MVQPNNISGLKIWLDANDLSLTEGQSVASWNGKGGTTINAVGSTKPPTLKLLDNRKYVYFDGAIAQRMDLTENIFNNNNPMTIFISLLSEMNGHILGISTSTIPYYTYLKGVGLQAGKYGVSARNNGTGALIETTNSDYIGKVETLTITIDNNNTSIKTKSESKKTNTANTVSFYNYLKATIGASDGGNSNAFVSPFGGYIAEIIVYDRVLNDVEIAQIEEGVKRRQTPLNKILISSSDGTFKSVIPLEYSSSVATPKMTSNSTPSGEVFGSPSYGGNEFFNAFSQVNNQYLTSVNANGHIGYKFPNSKVIGKYSLKSNITNVTHNPKDWKFEGSNDGASWTILDSQNGISWSATTEVKEYLISKDKIKPYLYYRLFWTTNNRGTYGGIGEISLYEVTLPKLIETTVSEYSFINHGMDKPLELDMSIEMSTKSFIEQSPTTLGSGKVFKKTIDTTQVPIKKVAIK